MSEGRSSYPSVSPNGLDQDASVDGLLTIAEVAAYLKLSRRTAWRWCKSGRLPALKIGHQWRVTRTDLEDFIRRQRKGVTT